MGAVADWRRVRRLGRYLVRDRRRLLVALLLLLPLAFAGALQPVLLGQAVSVLRGELSLPFLSGIIEHPHGTTAKHLSQGVHIAGEPCEQRALLRFRAAAARPAGGAAIQHPGRRTTAHRPHPRRPL